MFELFFVCVSVRIGVKLRVGLNGTQRVPLWLISLFHLSIREALTQHMTTLEQRLFHLFDPRDRKRARHLVPEKVICPRVGQVQATLASDDGTSHEVLLELSANRRGGMILESRCTSPDGRAGKPCALVAAVLLEVDRRGLLSGIAEQTPVTLDIVVDETDDYEEIESKSSSAFSQENETEHSGIPQASNPQLTRTLHSENRSEKGTTASLVYRT